MEVKQSNETRLKYARYLLLLCYAIASGFPQKFIVYGMELYPLHLRGSGSEGGPFQMKTPQQPAYLAHLVNNSASQAGGEDIIIVTRVFVINVRNKRRPVSAI